MVTPDSRQAGRTLDTFLSADLWLPERFVGEIFRQQRVCVGRARASRHDLVVAGRRIRLQGGVEEEFGVAVEGSASDPGIVRAGGIPAVLYEDDHLMVVDKPAGLLVHPGTPADVDTLAHRVARYYKWRGLRRRVRHVHRLDRDTTGAMLYAKHVYSARALDRMLAVGLVRRRYLAFVSGRVNPPEAWVRTGIGRDRHVAGRYRVSANGREAVTHYRTLEWFPLGRGGVSLVECELQTGRTHQIRVHMAYLGHPVVGDALYGGSDPSSPLSWSEGYALHAVELTFMHPYRQEHVCVRAPLPRVFADVLRRLGSRAVQPRQG
ncbi:MAG: RluA family pseudouridine synthase [Alicyclobacillaceae bacterium]|nr:RluA family pseudouridine synthase [Alicyclobacillaceae bacterium]